MPPRLPATRVEGPPLVGARQRLYVTAPATISQLTATCALPPTAATPVGAPGGGIEAASMMFTLVEVRPAEVAVKVREPSWVADWTSTSAKPLNTDRCAALSAWCELGSPLATPRMLPLEMVKLKDG